MTDIKNYESFVRIEPVNEGLSSDKKYYVETVDGLRLLLRVSDISEYERKNTMYEMMERVAVLGVPMPRPVDFGICDSGKSVYQLLTWCDGDNLENKLPSLSETEQYTIGLKAGEILRKIHSIPAPDDIEDWAVRYIRVNGDRIKSFAECGVQIYGSDAILQYFEDNKSLLKGRPQCFHHGDFHVGNFLVTENQDLSVIDWELLDYDNFADPWEEFNRLGNSKVVPHYATGLIRGYFGGSTQHGSEPPEEFWRLLALYLSTGALMLVSWAFYVQQDCLEYAIENANDVLSWFDHIRNPVPSWYLKNFHVQYIDGIPCKLKEPFDFSFLSEYGKVFKVFDEQSSGNISFGIVNGDRRYFLKFAGAQPEMYNNEPADAVDRLKYATQVYQDLKHPNLIKFIKAEEIGDGYAALFEWEDAIGIEPLYSPEYIRFMEMPTENKTQAFEEIMGFHAYIASKGYVAIDFYDGSILYNYDYNKVIICDIDFYQKSPYIGDLGIICGSVRFSSPEERESGAIMDEITNVYTMGAIAFMLFSSSDRSPEAWTLNMALYDVAKKAVSDDRNLRQQSIAELIAEWRAAK